MTVYETHDRDLKNNTYDTGNIKKYITRMYVNILIIMIILFVKYEKNIE